MAELQQLMEGHQTNGGLGFIPPPEAPETSVGSKRLRRPSVRLGDIGGDQYQQAPYDPHSRRSNRKESNQNLKPSSRTRALTNLTSGYDNAVDEDPIAIGTWRVNKWVKGSSGETTAGKRVRSNWGQEEEDEEETEEGFRDFSREDSESPRKERGVFENRMTTRYENMSQSGVKIWLEELGLGRYWPLFEMHEVDEEVLPFLTLEDLKDMGINAVGSRRKMFSAILKLGRDFS